MFIPIKQVQSWEDLEVKVQSFFNELGYEAKVNHPVTLANGGQAVVDVYAEKPDAPLLQKILFECKYWKSEVPRAIVQSFKMDVLESGANFGVIVSKTGFQSGAYEGVALTTVKLYTFEELQPNNSSGTGVAEGSSERLAEAVMRAQSAVRAFTQNIGGINGSGSGIHTIGIGNSNGLSHAQFEQNSTGTNAQQQQLPSMSAEERATNNAALIEVRMHITSLVIARTDCVELADSTCSR